MFHTCSDYCLGPKNKNKEKCRTCRFGFGTESEPNNYKTPGKEHTSKAKIYIDHKGVEHLLLPRQHSDFAMQHSRPLLQAWRANADMQLMIYQSNPDVPDISEIQNVCRYVVSYAGKRYQTTKQERNMIQDIIVK